MKTYGIQQNNTDGSHYFAGFDESRQPVWVSSAHEAMAFENRLHAESQAVLMINHAIACQKQPVSLGERIMREALGEALSVDNP